MKSIFFLLFFSSVCLYAQRTYTQKQQAYCWKMDGLTLYPSPDPHSPVIAIVPYTDAVTIIDTIIGTLYTDTFSWDPDNPEFPLMIKGGWIKVKYAKDTGYVFDGYLSRFPVTDLTGYFSDIVPVKQDTVKNTENDDRKTYTKKYKKEDGSSYKYIMREGCRFQTYYLPHVSFEEGIMLLHEEFGEDREECHFTLEEVQKNKYYFVECMLGTERRITLTKNGILIYTLNCDEN